MLSPPYAHQGSSTTGIMLQVCMAMLPCTLWGLYLFGWPAINLFILCCVSSVVSELLCLWLLKQPLRRVLDGSALLTGWLLALSLPPWCPWWVAVFGSFFAIAVGKQLYGGIGQNIFNPAMLGRTALLIAFPLQMTSWVAPAPLGSALAPSFVDGLSITFSGVAQSYDGLSAATALGHLKTSLTTGALASDVVQADFNLTHALLGYSAGSMGETSELLVLLGGLWLLWRRLISWEIPVALYISMAVLTFVSGHFAPQSNGGMSFHLASGGLLFGALFIATDPTTSPVSRLGKIIFGVGCAIVIFIIRTWGTFPEAVGFAVLFMNAWTPLLDRYFRPRIYGRLPNGQPLPELTSIQVIQEVKRK